MKIVIDIRHLTKPEPSGVGQYTTELLKALFALDKENEYFLFSSGSNRAKANLPVFDYPNVKSIHLNLPNRLLNLSLLTTGRPKFDEIITNKIGAGEKLLFFFPNLNIISLSPGTSYVLTLHDLSFEFFPELYNPKARLWHRLTRARALAQNAKAIIVPSKSAAHDVNFVFGVPKEKIFVVPHGVDPRFSQKIEAQDSGVRSRYHLPKKFALFVGTLEPRKNIALMIEAVAAYRKETKDDLRLVLVGKPTKYSQRLITRKHKEFIHELGYARSQDLPALFRLADVTLFPSLYEGFGLPIVESMACGTPVIAGKTSSMPEVGGRAALYIDPHKTNDLTAALRELLSSPELQRQKIAQGLERSGDFNWQKAAAATLAVFNSLS
ncbi:MAG: glycosyltransferase family 1 protein [Patescibacteria group bacterium]|jgi:glycosyltransferase involved in cell wall biosynthesis